MKSIGSVDAEPPLSMIAMLRKLWFLGVLGATIDIWSMLEIGVFVPFLYSRVRCCGPNMNLPSQYDIIDSKHVHAIVREAKSLNMSLPFDMRSKSIPACQVPHFPNHHKLWSMSPGCANRYYVENEAQLIMGINAPVQKAFTLLVLPIGGAYSDSFGRRPVLLVYISMCVLACVVYLLDSRLCHVWGNTMIVVGTAIICPCWEPKSSVISACVADMTGNKEKPKTRGMFVVYVCLASGSLIGFVLAFVCLTKHLSSYTILWLIYTLLALSILIFAWLAVPETLSEQFRSNGRFYQFNIFKSQYNTIRVMCRDRLLVCLMINNLLLWTHFCGFITQAYSYKIHSGFSPQEAIVPALVNSFIQAVGASTVGKFASNFKIMNIYLTGSFIMMFSYIAMGPLVNFFGHSAFYIGYACFGLGFSMIVPASSTTVSDRVAEEDQAKSQSSISWTNCVGALIAPLIWNLVLFDATAHGFRYYLPVYVSMILAIICFLIAALMAYKIDTWPKGKDIGLPLKAKENFTRSYDAT